MTRIRPFRALRYDPERVDLSRVIVPPYDVIAADEREDFYARDPHNAIRLELTREVSDEATTDYAQIRETLDAWQREAVLVRDAAPAFYALRQSFDAPDGTRVTRDGFFALLGLERYEQRIVRPHERTLAGPKADRLKVLRAARANLSSVLMLYEDPDDTLGPILRQAFDAEPLLHARDAEGGQTHSVARVDADASIGVLEGFLADRPVVIADGHHRYETALAYREEQRKASGSDAPAPHDWTLVCLANAYAPGTLLLPIHRLVQKGSVPTESAWSQRLPGWSCEVLSVGDAGDIPDLLRERLAPLREQGLHAFVADDASGRVRLFSRRARDGELGVRVIHREVIDGVFGLDEDAIRDGAIEYPKNALRTARDLRAGRGIVALYLNPLAPDDVFRVTAAGEVLPQKSTFFYPKLPTGLVFRTHDAERGEGDRG